LVSVRLLSTTAVEDKESTAPRKIPCTGVSQPLATASAAVIAMVRPICKAPPPMAIPRTWRNSLRENSTPRLNSKKVTPNWARVSTCTNSLIHPSPVGPTRIPASRYPSNTGCLSSAARKPPAAAAANTVTMSRIRRKSSCTETPHQEYELL